MKHVFFIDPLEKLNIKKDSTLLTALEFQKNGIETYLLFEKDFYLRNDEKQSLEVYSFSGLNKKDSFYIDSFVIDKTNVINLNSGVCLHMRIDPPYDMRYQRYLWILRSFQNLYGVKVLNDPLGIMKYNEKLIAMELDEHIQSFVGSSLFGFNKFCKKLVEQGADELILKPLDLYSGIGVEKLSLKDLNLESIFNDRVKKYGGAIIAQPFMKEVYKGEYRSVFFYGQEVGSILKIPQKGEFLTNIAQGAQFKGIKLPESAYKQCKRIADDLMHENIPFLAFDILGNTITEVNVTCPGLFVEVSEANKINLPKLYLDACLKN